MDLGKVFLFISFTTIVTIAEPSVYGNNGFYNTDKIVIKNKKIIALLRQKVIRQNERIDGLMSIVEGLSSTVNELKNTQASKLTSESKNDTDLLNKLGRMIDDINTNYVSKKELQEILNHTNKMNSNTTVTTNNLKRQNVKKLYSEGVRLFVKQRYDEAKKRFLITDTKGYKPAASNYYLGEIAYYTKVYEEAIFYFKKSAGLYDKASYIDTLLLHTAIALQKNGKKEQARVFYENIIENYVGKKTALIAKEKLKTL